MAPKRRNAAQGMGGTSWSVRGYLSRRILPAEVSSVVPETAQRTCEHPEVEDLGADGEVEFYLCQRCHDGIVVQGPRRWNVSASKVEGSLVASRLIFPRPR